MNQRCPDCSFNPTSLNDYCALRRPSRGVQRYRVAANSRMKYGVLQPDDEGQWIRAADHDSIVVELQNRITELEARLAEDQPR
jgi:predicted component of type VI protein secretion system